MSPDGALVAAGTDDGMVLLFDRHAGYRQCAQIPYPGNPDYASQFPTIHLAFQFNLRRKWLAITGRCNYTVTVMDVSDPSVPKHVTLLEGHTDHVNGICFSTDGSRFVTCSSDYTIKLWDTETFRLLRTIQVSKKAGLGSVQFYPNDNHRLLTVSYLGDATIWGHKSADP
jgi:WD40 repeat protein